MARELAVFGFFVVLAVVFTWPLAARLSTATSDLGDPLLNTWIIDWDLYAATHHVANVYQAPIFYPAKYPLAYSENLFGIAIFGLPMYLAGVAPLTTYNILFLLGLALCGYGAYVLVRVATASALAGLIAGVLYAFVPFRFDHRAHIQIIWGGWLPLILAALIAYWRRATWPLAIAFGAALLMNGLSNIHYLLFGTVAAAIVIGVLAFIDRRSGARFWIPLLVSGAAAVALLVPVLLPYRTVSEIYHVKREPPEVAYFSATWSDWLRTDITSATYGEIAPRDDEHAEKHLFPGLFVLFLTAAAIFADPAPLRVRILDVLIVTLGVLSYVRTVSPRHSSDTVFTLLLILLFIRLWMHRPQVRLPVAFWIGALWIAIGVAGSFGSHAFFHSLLYHRVSAFQAIRVPARWASIAYVGLAVTAGFGAAALMRRWRLATFAVLLAIAIFDVRPRLRWEHAITEIDPVYRWIRDTPYRGAFVEFPVDEDRVEWFYMLSATFHHRPTLNGTSGFAPPDNIRLRELTRDSGWTDALTTLLAKSGASIVVVHDDWLRALAPRAHDWLRRELATGRLVFLRRFDHRIGGDFVFALTANCRDCARFHVAGEDADLQRMLRGEPVYLARTFGVMDFPSDDWIKTKSLTVSGWALSPNGIRGVEVLLDSARTRYAATLTDRADVQAKFPWYPNVRRAGFTVTIPERPRRVSKYSDVQVEIIDGSGARTRLPDQFIVW